LFLFMLYILLLCEMMGGICVICMYRLIVLCVFFFQAKDGLRVLPYFRGLGGVFKRQLVNIKKRARLSIILIRKGQTINSL
ncbi:hypothetical protein KJR58_21570, partial [Escherichia coli]|uniref:hypothetical protein n=1 Tax=Escherichia coli TaxID=562 RepID=UPI0020053D14